MGHIANMHLLWSEKELSVIVAQKTFNLPICFFCIMSITPIKPAANVFRIYFLGTTFDNYVGKNYNEQTNISLYLKQIDMYSGNQRG